MENSITIVIQGKVFEDINLIIAEIKKYFPQLPVIVSTCNKLPCTVIGADYVIENSDPGFFYYSKRLGIRENNINRQIASTLAGLKAVKTPYVLKLRTDFRLNGFEFLKYFETLPKFNPDYRIFHHKVLACCYCTRNPRDKIFPYVYHPADIAFFGLTKDVIKLYDIPLMTEEEAYWDAENDYFNQYMPEQYIFIKSLEQQGKKINCRSYKDASFQNIMETEQYFTSNFVFLNYKNFNLLPSKPNFFVKNELHSFKTCYTQLETVKLYNSLQNDNVSISCIDKERLLINYCLVVESISKFIARAIFLLVPIRKIRKNYRPKFVTLLYKMFTSMF